MKPPAHLPIENKISYHFHDTVWLIQSLCHPTYANENRNENVQDNQRLEFLGDAVLGLVVGSLLMERYPDQGEGELTRIRAGLVREAQLARIARALDLGRYLMLGKGEAMAGGAQKPSILADTLEALVAAVYLDGGFQKAFDMVKRWFTPLLGSDPVDPKTQLQELLQKRHKATPAYRITAETGPDHDKTFHVTLSFENLRTEGVGKNKKQAEQEAAKKALELIKATAR